MSRIQDILKKAEREGTVQRTRAFASEPAEWVSDRPSTAQALAERPPVNPPPVAPMPPLPIPRAAGGMGIDARLVAAHAPQSLAAEQYRSLRTRIKSAENGRAFRTLII